MLVFPTLTAYFISGNGCGAFLNPGFWATAVPKITAPELPDAKPLTDTLAHDGPTVVWLVRAAVLLLALLLSWLIPKLMRRHERTLTKKQSSSLEAYGKALKPLSVGVVLLIWTLACNYLLAQFSPSDKLLDFLDRVLRSFYLISIGALVYGFLPLLTHSGERTLRRFGREAKHSLNRLFLILLRILLVLVALSAVLSVWSINLSGIITGLGIGSLAIALAAQNLLSNLIGGATIMLDRPFVIGDFISAGDLSGTVEEIGWRSTRLRTSDQEVVTMPNSTLMSANIVNISRQRKRRVFFELSVRGAGQEERLEAFMDSLKKTLGKREKCRAEEGVSVFLREIGLDIFKLTIYYYINETDYDSFVSERSAALLQCSRLAAEADLPFAKLFEQSPFEGGGTR